MNIAITLICLFSYLFVPGTTPTYLVQGKINSLSETTLLIQNKSYNYTISVKGEDDTSYIHKISLTFPLNNGSIPRGELTFQGKWVMRDGKSICDGQLYSNQQYLGYVYVFIDE